MLFKAQIASSQLFSTARGKRLYVVFKSADKDELGLWLTPSQLKENDLQVGDVVFLKHNRQGQLRFIFHPLPCELQLKLFSWFNSGRRLSLKRKSSPDYLDHF